MELRELEEIVAQDPDAIDPFLVYADHLQEEGDPRGELVALDLMRLEDPHDPERVRAIGRHLDLYQRELLGPLVDLGSCLKDVHWRLGFIKRATLWHPEGAGPEDLARLAELLLESPSGRFIQELTITPLLDGDYTSVIGAIGLRIRPNLRSLTIGPTLRGESWLDLGGAYGALSNLRSLCLNVNECRFGPLSLPSLENLELWAQILSEETARSIAAADWPKLTRLSLATRGGTRHLRQALAGEFPCLESLRVWSYFNLTDTASALAGSQVASRLVDLTFENAGVAELALLADGAHRFARLERLVVSSEDADDDVLHPFLSRGVRTELRRPLIDLNPWEERTEVDHGELDAGDDATIWIG